MSSSINIPKRRKKTARHLQHDHHDGDLGLGSSTTPGSSSSSSFGMESPAESSSAAARSAAPPPPPPPGLMVGSSPMAAPGSKRFGGEIDYGRVSVGSWDDGWRIDEWGCRRPSLLGSSIRQSEHTVINIGGDDAPRLITCVRSSQGFDWNQEIFLPSYSSRRHGSAATELEHKQDPIEDIILTDEEAAGLIPS